MSKLAHMFYAYAYVLCVLIVWYLCSVPNLVQIYVIVTDIDALVVALWTCYGAL